MYRAFDQVIYRKTARGWVAVGADDVCSCACITIPTSLGGVPVVGIADGAFAGCRDVETLVIAPGVTHIGAYAFASCLRLTEIWLPDTVTEIGEGAFRNCDRLRSVILPPHLQEVAYMTFLGCDALAFVSLPQDCGALGWLSFANIGEVQPCVWVPRRLSHTYLGGAFQCAALLFEDDGGDETVAERQCRYHTVGYVVRMIPGTERFFVHSRHTSRDAAIRSCLGNAVADAYARPWEEIHK